MGGYVINRAPNDEKVVGSFSIAGMCGNRTHPRRDHRLTTDLKSAGTTRSPCIPEKTKENI